MTRGSLRIYLGSAPGVGKTVAMLGEGRRRVGRGADVVIGVVDDHGRSFTREAAAGLEVVPRRVVRPRGVPFEEMDVDAILSRRPEVVLVDELAHVNAPGCRHARRHQDVEELLAAGIDVITTLDIASLESLTDVVESITGVRRQDTVPDSVVRAADQIELVDMSPEALRRRMAHGNVYAADSIDAALGNYFRIGNLTALRELALLWLADRVEEGLQRYRHQHDIHGTWAARDRIVVAVPASDDGEILLRRGARIAGRIAGRDLVAVHVVRSEGVGGSAETVTRLRRLTEDLGGTFHTVVGDDVAHAVLGFTRAVNGTQVVVGARRRGRLARALRRSISSEIVHDSGDVDVHVVTREPTRASRPGLRRPTRRRWLAWALALLLPVALSLALLPVRDELSLVTELLLLLVGVILVALVGGIVPAVVSALLASLLANYVFTPPYGSLTIAEPEHTFALVVFVMVAGLVSTIVDRSTRRTQEASAAQAEAQVLASLATGVLRRDDGIDGLLEQALVTFGMRSAALLERPSGTARWCVVAAVGSSPAATPEEADAAAQPTEALALAVSGHTLSVPEQRLLDAYAAQAAAVLERQRLTTAAAEATRLQQADAARTALLAAVSHDLRTPLAVIKANVSSLRDPSISLSPEDSAELLADTEAASDRLDGLLSNLLDMSRLQTGAVQPVLRPAAVEELVHRGLRGVVLDRVEVAVPDDLPLVSTDVGLAERVVANVAENAVRHSPADRSVRITAGMVPGDDLVEIRISDRGPGVPQRDREAMFAPFQRLGDVPAGNGVGLGLAVARGLADAVHARLEAEDTPGGGLTMVLTLPLADRAEGTAR